jgi:hypothetical protein
MGEERLQALLQESLAVATRTAAMKPSDLARIVVDSTVQPKAVMFPTDAKLLNLPSSIPPAANRPGAVSDSPRVFGLDVNFQEVVHSVLAGKADVVRHSDSRRTEWTSIRMPA